MSEEKPLHVRVAKALGWTYVGPGEGDVGTNGWEGEPPPGHPMEYYPRRLDQHVGIPLYDTDRSASGQIEDVLLHRFGQIDFRHQPDNVPARRYGAGLYVVTQYYIEYAPTLGEAVCELFLALHAAGKLGEEER